jgi:hypothetical protein
MLIIKKHVDLRGALRHPEVRLLNTKPDGTRSTVATGLYSSARCVCHIHQPRSPCVALLYILNCLE